MSAKWPCCVEWDIETLTQWLSQSLCVCTVPCSDAAAVSSSRSAKSSHLMKQSPRPDVSVADEHTNSSEIVRLEALCDSKTRRLSAVSAVLTERTRWFEAMTIVVQYQQVQWVLPLLLWTSLALVSRLQCVEWDVKPRFNQSVILNTGGESQFCWVPFSMITYSNSIWPVLDARFNPRGFLLGKTSHPNPR